MWLVAGIRRMPSSGAGTAMGDTLWLLVGIASELHVQPASTLRITCEPFVTNSTDGANGGDVTWVTFAGPAENGGRIASQPLPALLTVPPHGPRCAASTLEPSAPARAVPR